MQIEKKCISKQKQNLDECQCECKEIDYSSSSVDDYMWNPSSSDGKVKLMKYLDIKNCSCEKRLFGKLVTTCEDQILNTMKPQLIIKKQYVKKIPFSHDVNGNYMLVIISRLFCQLLLLICKRLDKNVSNLDIQYLSKMNSVKEIDIKNHAPSYFDDMFNTKSLDTIKIKID